MNPVSLVPYSQRLELINETARQIIKDFGLFNIEIKFSGNAENAYRELFSQIHPAISHLLDKQYEKAMNLLYRIDVSEKQVAEAVQEKQEVSFSEIITELIILREFQKILTRRKFFGG